MKIITNHIKQKIVAILSIVGLTATGYSQSIFSESFETVTHPNLPALWTTTTLGTDGGFYSGNSDSAQVATFWLVKEHTSFALTNDDACGCDKSDDYLIMPTIDLSGYADSTVFLQFDAWIEDFWGGIATIKVDTGSGWIDVYTMDPSPEWQTRIVNMSAFTGNNNVLIAFHYNDMGASTLGLAIDNVSLYVPSNQYDVAIYSTRNTYSDYTQVPVSQLTPVQLTSTIYNNGQDTLSGVKLIAQSLTGYADTSLIGDLAPATYTTATFNNSWSVSGQGLFSVNYSIIHDSTDDFMGNNTAVDILQVSDSIMAKEQGVIGDAQIPLDGETIAQVFRVFKKDTITSVSLHFLMAAPSDNIKFYFYNMAGGFPDNIIDSSQAFTSLTSGWNTFYLDSEMELDTGYYAIGMKKIGGGLTGLSASENYYVPNTTFTSRYFVMDYFWYWDEQAYPGTMADHHTYLMRPNFGKDNLSVGVFQVEADNTFNVYPNPSTGWLYIQASDKIEEVNIYDVSGKLVIHQQNMSINKLDLTQLEKGLYFGQTRLSKGWETFKIILK